MSAIDPKGDQKYWGNGEPYEGIRLTSTQVGTQKYWFEGITEQNLMPLQNADTGKFFLLFN